MNIDWVMRIASLLPDWLYSPCIRRLLKLQGADLASGSVFGAYFSCRSPHRVSIGRDFQAQRMVTLLADGRIVIGDRVSINERATINSWKGGSIRIGNDCMIGPGCVIRSADHAHDAIDVPMNLQGYLPGDIELEEDVWIGGNVTICKGVRIGRQTIVGAGAVVTRSLPAFAVAVGVPARVIKTRGAKT